MTPIQDSLVVVTGLPRSGTSMPMQMLSAGGIEVVSDGLPKADEDNPHGYLEFEPVKSLLRDSSWLSASRGKAIKIVAPLLSALWYSSLPRNDGDTGNTVFEDVYGGKISTRVSIRAT